MGGKFLLDTSVLVALFADDASVKEKLVQADEVFIPVIAVGELYYGALKSQRVQENLAMMDKLEVDHISPYLLTEVRPWSSSGNICSA